MPTRRFKDHVVDVIHVEDVRAGESIIEFRYPTSSALGSHVAVVLPEGGGWPEAVVAIRPDATDISAEFVEWAIGTAREILFPTEIDRTPRQALPRT